MTAAGRRDRPAKIKGEERETRAPSSTPTDGGAGARDRRAPGCVSPRVRNWRTRSGRTTARRRCPSTLCGAPLSRGLAKASASRTARTWIGARVAHSRRRGAPALCDGRRRHKSTQQRAEGSAKRDSSDSMSLAAVAASRDGDADEADGDARAFWRAPEHAAGGRTRPSTAHANGLRSAPREERGPPRVERAEMARCEPRPSRGRFQRSTETTQQLALRRSGAARGRGGRRAPSARWSTCSRRSRRWAWTTRASRWRARASSLFWRPRA